MDAMVTGRMSASKKERGNRVLSELGTNASKAINALYDYVIEHRALPFPADRPDRSELLRTATSLVDAIPRVRLDERHTQMSIKDAQRERLSQQIQPRDDA